MPPDHSCQTCKYRLVSCSPYWVDNQCQHWVSSQECATCPLEGRVVALEALVGGLVADAAAWPQLAERLQALERPAAPAQRQPARFQPCHECLHHAVLMDEPPCVDCKQHWQPRQGAGL